MQVGAHFPPVTPACNSHLHFPREADPMKVGVMDFMGEGARCLLPAGTSCLTSHQLLSLPYLLPPPLPAQVVVPDTSCCLALHQPRSHISFTPFTPSHRFPRPSVVPGAPRCSRVCLRSSPEAGSGTPATTRSATSTQARHLPHPPSCSLLAPAKRPSRGGIVAGQLPPSPGSPVAAAKAMRAHRSFVP